MKRYVTLIGASTMCDRSALAAEAARAGTERKRRLRARQLRGEIIVGCVVGLHDLEFLIDLGWLAVSESENRSEIGHAIMSALRSARDVKISGTRGQPNGSKHGFSL